MKYAEILFMCCMALAIFTKPERADQPKDLYMMYSHEYGLYKIGVSNNPERRRNEVDRFVKGDVQLLKVYPQMEEMEKELHGVYTERRVKFPDTRGVRSVEWFCLKDRHIMEIDSIVTNRKIENEFCHANKCAK